MDNRCRQDSGTASGPLKGAKSEGVGEMLESRLERTSAPNLRVAKVSSRHPQADGTARFDNRPLVQSSSPPWIYVKTCPLPVD